MPGSVVKQDGAQDAPDGKNTLIPVLDVPEGVVARGFKLPLYIDIERSPGENLGLSIEGMKLVRVSPGKAGDRAGARALVGLSLTHVEGEYVTERSDSLNKPEMRLHFGLRNEHHLTRSATEPLGMKFDERQSAGNPTPYVVFQHALPDTAAGRCGLRHFAGHVVSHINGARVVSVADVKEATAGQTSLLFRFASSQHSIPPEAYATTSSVAGPASGFPVPRPPRRPFCPVLTVPDALAREAMHLPIAVQLASEDGNVSQSRFASRGLELFELKLISVAPGSPAERAGAARCIGLSLIRCGGAPVACSADLRPLEGPGTLEVFFGLRNEAEIDVSSTGDLGLITDPQDAPSLHNELLCVMGVVPGGVSEKGGAHAFIGALLTHIDAVHVKTLEGPEAFSGKGKVVLRFADPLAEFPPETAATITGAWAAAKEQKQRDAAEAQSVERIDRLRREVEAEAESAERRRREAVAEAEERRRRGGSGASAVAPPPSEAPPAARQHVGNGGTVPIPPPPAAGEQRWTTSITITREFHTDDWGLRMDDGFALISVVPGSPADLAGASSVRGMTLTRCQAEAVSGDGDVDRVCKGCTVAVFEFSASVAAGVGSGSSAGHPKGVGGGGRMGAAPAETRQAGPPPPVRKYYRVEKATGKLRLNL